MYKASAAKEDLYELTVMFVSGGYTCGLRCRGTYTTGPSTQQLAETW